jgi:HEAT repeat protein
MWPGLQLLSNIWRRDYLMMQSNRALVEMLATDDASIELVGEILDREDAIVPDLIWSLDRPEFMRPYGVAPDKIYGVVLHSMVALIHYNYLKKVDLPILAVLECLEILRSDSSISGIATLVDHPHQQVRQHAADVLIAIDTEECIEPLKAFLSDASVAYHVARTLERELPKGTCSDELTRELFEPLWGQLGAESSFERDSIASCLISMDRERTVALLTEPSFISPARKNAGGLLGELMKNNVLLPEAFLLDLIQRTEAEPQSYSNECLLKAAIRMLSSYDSPTTRAELIRHQTSKVKDVRIEAWEGFLRLEGVGDPWQALAGFNLTNIGQADVRLRTAARIRDIIDQVANGGFSQWYVNGYGHEWKDTRDALIAVGATHSIKVLDRTLSKFGPDGPPGGDDLDEAVRQIHAATEELPWEDETRDFGTDPDDLEVLLLKYMIEHKEVFGRKP